MSLQKQYILICLALTILLGGSYISELEARKRSDQVANLQEQLFHLNQLADILRNSVENQMRYAHDYYHTGDRKYIDDFEFIQAWRNGQEPIPLSYPIGGGRRIYFEKLIKAVARSNADIVPLIRAFREAENLASYEMSGIMALQGLEPDGKTSYRGLIPPKTLAKQILLGAEIYRRKDKVISNIDDFLVNNSEMFNLQSSRLHRVTRNFRRISIILEVMIGLIFLSSSIYLIKVVFIPISRATTLASAIASGDMSRRWKLNRSDELGQLSDAFDTMVNALQVQVQRVERQNEVTDRLINTVHQAHMGQWRWDLHFHTIELDDNCLKMLGYSEQDFNGSERDFFSRVHPEDLDLLKDFAGQFKNQLDWIGNVEFRVKHKRRDVWIWLEAIGVPGKSIIRSKSRLITGLLHDISPRKKAEDEQAKIFARLKLVLDGIPARITVINLEDYKILFMNRAAIEKFGNGVGRECYTVLQKFERDAPCSFCRNDEVLDENGKPAGVISWQYQSSIDHRWYEQHTQALEWEGGEMACVQIAFDINDLREAREELSSYSENLEQMVGDRTLEIQRKNTELKMTLTELREAQVQLIQAEKMAALGHLIAGIAHEINTPLGAIRTSNETLDNAFGHVLAALPYLADHYNGEHRDLTNRLIEAASNAGMDTLTMREKRELRKKVSGQLSKLGVDDARAIASLVINLQLTDYLDDLIPLLRDENSSELLSAIQYITNIRRSNAIISTAVNRAAKTVFALKTYAHTDSTGRETRASLLENMETVLVLYHNQIKHNVQLICDYDDNIPDLLCHPDELNQVWTNLIHNALQAMDYKGVLTVSIKVDGNDIVVAVKDTGCGIPDDIMQRVFEPFFTTKSAGEGSGLGLDIVRGIVESHGGRVGIDTKVGKGTTFTVYLPIDRTE
jgi:two-component system, NtrC family, sensor kinase